LEGKKAIKKTCTEKEELGSSTHNLLIKNRHVLKRRKEEVFLDLEGGEKMF